MSEKYDEIMAKLAQTSVGPLLDDEAALERALVDLMAESPDARLAEMGRELRGGTVSWSGLLDIPAYAEALEAGFTALEHIDMDQLSADLDAEIAAEQQPEPPAEPADEPDDGDDLWQGFRGDR